MKLIRVFVFVFSTLLLASSAFGQQPGLVFPDRPIGPAPGGGVFTQNCEILCNAVGITCGFVTKDADSYCCCIGSCPAAAPMCTFLVTQCLPRPGGPVGQ